MATRGCKRCGKCGCGCTVLPYAAEVTLSGLQNQTRAMQCQVQFDACFGQGVEAVVVAPGGCPEYSPAACAPYCPEAYPGAGYSSLDNSGPVSGVVLTSGGSCYAKVGRDDPTGYVAARALPTGNVPPLSVELRPRAGSIPENTDTSNPIRVAHIVVRDDGQGTNAISLSGPDAASFQILGSELYLKAGVTLDFEEQEYYRVAVSVADGTTPMAVPATDTFTLTLTDSIREPGNDKAEPDVANPPPAPPPATNAPAEEATFTVVFERHIEDPPCTAPSSGACMPEGLEMPETPYWKISRINVNGGTRYAGGEMVTLTFADGVIEELPAVALVVAGADGIPTDVEIVAQGRYYKEDRNPDATIISPVWGCVRCKVEVATFQHWDGSSFTVPYVVDGDTGARIRGVVEGDPASKTFGEVIGLEVVAAGNKAIGWRWSRSCASLLNGKPITVFGSGGPLVSFELDSCYGKGACIVAEPAPSRYEPTLFLLGKGNCHTVFPAFNTPAPLYGCGGSISYTTQKFFEDDDPTRPYWSVVSVEASGGTKYASNLLAHVFVHNPVTNRPLYRCPVVGELPQIVLQATSGSLTGATIVNKGKFWLERPYVGEPVSIERLRIQSGGDPLAPYAKIGRVAPSLTLQQSPAVAGVGATLTPQVAQAQDECKVDYWYIKSASVTGGQGYKSGDQIVVVPSEGDTVYAPARLSLEVDREGVPSGVKVAYGGQFWRESKAVPAYVSDFKVVAIQLAPSNGQEAEIGVTIDSNPNSDTFGMVVDATVKAPGQKYTLAGQFGCSYDALDCDVTVAVSQESLLIGVADGIASGHIVGDPIAENCSEWESAAAARNGLNAGAAATVIAPATQIPSCVGPPVCYERCPDLRFLCISVVVNTPLGEATATSADFFWIASAGRISGGTASELYPPAPPPPDDWLFISAGLTIECGGGVLRISGGWAGLPAPECFCTSAAGCVAIPCAEGNWWEGTFSFPLQYDAGLGGCENCPAPGSVQVTIATPAGAGVPC